MMENEFSRVIDALPGLLAAEKDLLELVTRGRPLPEVLQALCQRVEAITGDGFCNILLVDPSGANFLVGAGPSSRMLQKPSPVIASTRWHRAWRTSGSGRPRVTSSRRSFSAASNPGSASITRLNSFSIMGL